MSNQILFYDPKYPNGCFSNFSGHAIEIYGKRWKTSEAAFQAMKFEHRPDLVEVVWKAKSPGKAAEIGRNRSLPLRQDWEHPMEKLGPRIDSIAQIPAHNYIIEPPSGSAAGKCVLELVKDVFMYEVVYAKFDQNQEIGKFLSGTGKSYIIEDAVHDPYWGWGASKVGRNKLGRILMMVRHALKTGSGKPFNYANPRTASLL